MLSQSFVFLGFLDAGEELTDGHLCAVHMTRDSSIKCELLNHQV
jgi:hypothetical protein